MRKAPARTRARVAAWYQTPFAAVRTKTHKHVEYEDGERELYDLQAAPYELENVHQMADSSLVEELKARLEALRDCEGEGV